MAEKWKEAEFLCPYCFKKCVNFEALEWHIYLTKDKAHGGAKGYPKDWESRKRAIKAEREVEMRPVGG